VIGPGIRSLKVEPTDFVTAPDPEILALAQQVVNQNEQILRMNADLLKVIAYPIFIVKPRT
jgi:hypothetical protein